MDSRTFAALLRPLTNRVRNSAARAVVRLVNDGAKMQALQLGILAGETVSGVERFQEYGFRSFPFAGAEAAVIFLGGDRSHGLAIAVDDRRYKIELAEGEVAIFDDQGQKVHITRGGVLVESQFEVRLKAPSIVFEGPVTGTETAGFAGDVTAEGVSTAHHTHGGVQSGGGNTGEPNGGA